MQYQRFDPADCSFPRPRVPILPALSRQSLAWRPSSPFTPPSPGAKSRLFTRGRYAVTEAYRQSGIGKEGALLAPAYHCRTMLDPAIRLGAEIALYPLKPDLKPDLQALEIRLATCQQPIKALLVTHYFGFPQDLELLAGICAKHGISLIEDCSHVLLHATGLNTFSHSGAMGKTGRFCFASPYKFFPCEDGGILWAPNPQGLPENNQQTAPTTLTQEFKGLLHSVQRALGRNQAIDINELDDEINALAGLRTSTGRDVQEQDPHVSKLYLAKEEHLENLSSSRWIMRHTNVARLASRRRENYLQWLRAVADLPHCQALVPKLPADCVPYMFPLRIDHPEVHFFALKQLGVPVWRWDDMAVSDCPVAANYRLQLLHLPCHQELSEQQMSWMTTAVNKVMLQCPVTDK